MTLFPVNIQRRNEFVRENNIYIWTGRLGFLATWISNLFHGQHMFNKSVYSFNIDTILSLHFNYKTNVNFNHRW